MMISFEGNYSKQIAKTIIICLLLIIVPAIILISFTIRDFNTYQPGRALEVPTPTTPPWIIIITASPVPTNIPASALCTDSDGGNNYYQTGFVSGTGSGCTADGLYDTCFTAAHVKEYYCDSTQACTNVYFNCPYGCQNGACLSAPVTSTPAITSVTNPTVSPTIPASSPTIPLASPTIPVYSPSVTSGCPRRAQGDADCNGSVDLIDFEIWRETFVGGIFTLTSDFDPDGIVNLIDFEVWRLGFTAQ